MDRLENLSGSICLSENVTITIRYSISNRQMIISAGNGYDGKQEADRDNLG